MAHLNTVLHSFLRQTNRWSQFVALLMGQILGLNSLREIESAQNDVRAKLYHVGAKPVARTTLARVNENEDYRLFQNLFTLLSQKLMRFSPDSKLKRQGVGKLLLMDATLISLCLSVNPWAGFRKNKGGIKLHVGVNAADDTMVMPVFCDLTTGDVHEINHARKKDYPEGSLLCFDRGYTDYQWWDRLTEQNIGFVTRLRSNAIYSQIRHRAGRRSANVQDDELIQLKGGKSWYRLIHYTDPETGNQYKFITNSDTLKAQTIADVYKKRWAIELFFKWMKQNLKITKFVGTSENAVLTQIWIALCLYLLLAFIKLKSKTKVSIREILKWICRNLFARAIIWDYLTPKQTQTIALRQLSLF